MTGVIEQFLGTSENLVLSNPASPIDKKTILDACDSLDIKEAVLLATSGSSGMSRLVVLSRAALRISARSVNALLGIGCADVWVCVLPVFHAGGLAIYIRADESGSKVFALPGKWNPANFVDCCNERRATLSSLVPTQLFDLLELDLPAPATLRAIIVGGAPLDPELRDAALRKGWPVLETYGMTEAGSQIATQRHEGDGMEILDCWDVRVGDNSILKIRGEPLFSGYLESHCAHWELVNPLDPDGFFTTGDSVELSGRILKFIGRSDSIIKILGERIDLDSLQARLEAIAGIGGAVIACPDERNGHKLILVAEEGIEADIVVNQYNGLSTGPERISAIQRVNEIPRTALGKLRRNEVKKMINSHGGDYSQLV